MRIGKFAKHFQVNKSTIRYYTDLNLLLPNTSDVYPDYDDKALKDMEDITSLKAMGFSLDEILHIKALNRYFVKYSDKDLEYLTDIIDQKMLQIKASISELNNQLDSLKNYKKTIQVNKSDTTTGIHFDVLNLLQCPICQSYYDVKNADIHNQVIQSGRLTCLCNSSIRIHEGIINVCPPPENIKDTRKNNFGDFLGSLSNEHFSTIKKTGNVLSEIINKWDHSKGIIFMNADNDILIMDLERQFVASGHYLMCSNDYNSLVTLKNNLERKSYKGKITLIYYKNLLPIKSNIPYLIDNAGHLNELILNQTLGTTLNNFNRFSSSAIEWILIHYYNKRKTSPMYQMNYLQKYKKLDLHSFDVRPIGDFKPIEGILPRSDMLHVDLIRLKLTK